MLHQLRLIAEALPWTMPALAGGGVLALLTMLFFPKRRSRSDRVGFALFVWCLVVALAVTLSPVKTYYFGEPTLGCNLDVWSPLNYHYWLSSGSRPPNVWLLLPGSLGAMLLDGVGRRFLAIGLLIALPPGVEALQDLYPELKRSCSSQDIIDNWTGLAIGLGIGLVLMGFIGLARLARRRRNRALQAGVGRQEWREEPSSGYAENGSMPLGGRDTGGYSDFGDFDDSPSSTRWWAQREEQETRQMPQTSRRLEHEETSTPRPEGRVDATQVMPTRSPEAGPDSDTTQIIPRG